MKGSLLTIFWSQPAKGRSRSRDNDPTSTSDTSARSRRISEVTRKVSYSSENDNFPKQNTRESHPRLRSPSAEKRVRSTVRHLLQSRKGKSSKAMDVFKEKSIKDDENIFSYPVVGRTYEMPDEVKDELDVMACNEDSVRLVHFHLY
jgi:hypothetical protein